MKNLRQQAVAGAPIRESREISDSELLDFLEKDILEHGPLLLHDGFGNCGMNRGLACLATGLTGRNLRRAIRDMMPKRAEGTAE